MPSDDTPSLAGCYVKLGRAGKHRKELDAALGPALDLIRESVVVETTYDVDAKEFHVKVAYAPPMPEGISAIAGDVLHNLRSALDYAAYQAVWKSQGSRWDESQFPIATGRELFSRRDRDTMARLDTAFVTVIKRHQFFKDPNDYRLEGLAATQEDIWWLNDTNRPLAVLQSLSNWDKHRLLLPRYAAIGDSDFGVKWARYCDPVLRMSTVEGSLEPSAHPVATFDANPHEGAMRPQMDVNFDFRPVVGLARHGDTQELLDVIASKVLTIIREFEPLFGEGNSHESPPEISV